MGAREEAGRAGTKKGLCVVLALWRPMSGADSRGCLLSRDGVVLIFRVRDVRVVFAHVIWVMCFGSCAV